MIVLGILILFLTIMVVYQALCLSFLRDNEKLNLINRVTRHGSADRINSKRKAIRKVLIRAIPIEFILDIILVVILLVMLFIYYVMGNIFSTSVINSFNFRKGSCDCYCRCTRDNTYEYLSNYRWIFGEQAYLEFLGAIMTEGKAKEINDNKESTGYEKDKSLLEYIGYFQNGELALNNTALQIFKKHATSNSKFCNLNGIDRSKLSDNDLKQDLEKLLSQKRNKCVNEECDVCGKDIRVCTGIPRYIESKGYNVYSERELGGLDEYGTIAGYVPGKATGSYAIKLDDGYYYYWYNQGNSKYGNVLPEGKYYWGTNSYNKTITYDGCGIYTLAMMISNLIGNEVTCHDVLMAMDSRLDTNARRYYLSLGYFAEPNLLRYAPLTTLANAYGLGSEIGRLKIDRIDELLSEHKYCYIMYHQNEKSVWSDSNNHFMAIRKRDADGNYYCFNSTGGANNYRSMNTPMPRSELAKLVGNYYVVAFWKDDYSGSIEQSELGLNIDESQIYQKLLGYNSGKAKMLTEVYRNMISNGASPEEAIGMMANAVEEGNYGQVEQSFALYHHYGFKLPSGGGYIKTIEDIKYLKNWVSARDTNLINYKNGKVESYTYNGDTRKTVPWSCGVGCIQWSAGRRIGVLNSYQSIMKINSDVTEENMSIAEIDYLMQEYFSSYRNTVLSSMQDKEQTAENWAEAICDFDIKPSGYCGGRWSGTGSCGERRKRASEIKEIIR